ncbi:MAG: hypothetical protein FWD15_05810 [Alphaproteobacteria bacterium]|nr:hypothetical protein [Alphaproteobacteria bacterium]
MPKYKSFAITILAVFCMCFIAEEALAQNRQPRKAGGTQVRRSTNAKAGGQQRQRKTGGTQQRATAVPNNNAGSEMELEKQETSQEILPAQCTLALINFEEVAEANLSRQIWALPEDIRVKCDSACAETFRTPVMQDCELANNEACGGCYKRIYSNFSSQRFAYSGCVLSCAANSGHGV